MARKFAEIAFTPADKVAQTRYGSRAGASKLEQGEDDIGRQAGRNAGCLYRGALYVRRNRAVAHRGA